MVLGVATGLFFGEIVAPLKLVGDAFIGLLQITVIPYIVVALITGLGRLSYDEARALALKGGSVLLVLWTISIAMVLVLPLAFPDWPSRSFFQKSSIEVGPAPDFLELYIPSNPFFALSNAIVPAVVVFSILLGLALIGVKQKALVLGPLSALAESLMRITGLVTRLAPLGVFALTANTAGTMSFVDLARLQVWVVLFVFIALVLGLWLLPALITCVTPLRYTEILRAVRTPLVTAFATGSALVVLPLLAENCKELTAAAHRRAAVADDEEETESSVDVLIPTFYSFPTAGNLLNLGFVLFAGWYIGSSVSVTHYPSIIFAGLASLFGGKVLAIPFVLGLAELPRDLFDVFMSIDVISARFVTFLATMHYSTIALIGTFALAGLVRIRALPLLRAVAIGGALIVAIMTGVRAFYTHVVVVPYTKDEALKGLHLLRRPQQAVVYREPPTAMPGTETGDPRSYAEIVDSGVLRICYLPGNYPLSFFNASGELVGFDVEMAHRLAKRLDLGLEFVPLERLRFASEQLDAGYCDAVFNALAVNLDTAETVAATNPFSTATAAFIVADHRRDDFSTWEKVRQQGEIVVATSAFQVPSSDILARLPKANVTRFSSFEEQDRYFESGGVGAEAFLDTAGEGAAWTILYPHFTVVVPRPVLQLPIAYMVARDNPSLLRTVNTWLLIEKQTGGIDDLYDYWVQGKTRQVQPPRWSVLRDVLGWVD